MVKDDTAICGKRGSVVVLFLVFCKFTNRTNPETHVRASQTLEYGLTGLQQSNGMMTLVVHHFEPSIAQDDRTHTIRIHAKHLDHKKSSVPLRSCQNSAVPHDNIIHWCMEIFSNFEECWNHACFVTLHTCCRNFHGSYKDSDCMPRISSCIESATG